MARSIFCSNSWSLASVPKQSSGILWNFQGDRSVFCSNAVPPRGLLDAGWSPERPSYDEKLGIGSLTLGRGNGPEMELITDHACTMKLS